MVADSSTTSRACISECGGGVLSSKVAVIAEVVLRMQLRATNASRYVQVLHRLPAQLCHAG